MLIRGAVVKNPPAAAGDAGDQGSIPGLGRSPEQEMATYSSILAWEIPWTGAWQATYSPWGHRRGRHDLSTKQQQQTD